MKFYLKNDRSEQFSYFKDKWYCIGRENEIHSLQHILKNLDSSSILISGVRWTWKTSFVHKTIKWLKDGFVPIFVNIKDIKNSEDWTKTHLLTSIIRATYLSNEKLDNSEDLEKLYYNSLWNFEEFQESTDDENEENQEKKTVIERLTFSWDFKEILMVVWCCLIMVGIFTLDKIVWRIISTILGLVSITISHTKIFEKIEKKVQNRRKIKWLKWKIENSQEFLEIEFEKWLKLQDKKMIFVIDEMDKIWDSSKVLRILKEQKNLFTRSYAHFLFITDESFYESVNSSDRKDEKEWIFPTIFSHVYYLPTPQSEDLQEYLNNIIETNITEENKKEFEDLKSYLLFNSLNDYFLLKRCIHDNLEYELDKAFLSLDTLKGYDKSFEDKVNIYNYINNSLEKFIYTTKWKRKSNADLVNYVYSFLNHNLWKNFTSNDVKYSDFFEILLRWWLITRLDSSIYVWTGKYDNLKSAHELYKYEEEFLLNFKEMIKIANDLDDYKDILEWKQEDFQSYQDIKQWRDGTHLSNISLYSKFEKYQKLYDDLRNNRSVYKIKKEETESANKEVKLNIDNIKNSIPTIVTNIIAQIITKPFTISNVTVTFQNPHIINKFNQFPNLKSEVQKLQHSVSCIWDKIVLIINRKEWEQNELLKEHNEVYLLKGSKNILVIDMKKTSNDIWIKNKSYSFIDQTDKRKREKGIIDNYYIVNYNDIRDLKNIFPKIKSFLEN